VQNNDMASAWGFFYGGLINPDVMAQMGMVPTGKMIASLPGFELTISPLFNVEPKADAIVYGLLLRLTHVELEHVYGQLKLRYFPQPVVAYDENGGLHPALCYVIPDLPSAQADPDYVLRLLQPAIDHGFPDWYITRIKSYLPQDHPKKQN
jgi:hypothetical protein